MPTATPSPLAESFTADLWTTFYLPLFSLPLLARKLPPVGEISISISMRLDKQVFWDCSAISQCLDGVTSIRESHACLFSLGPGAFIQESHAGSHQAHAAQKYTCLKHSPLSFLSPSFFIVFFSILPCWAMGACNIELDPLCGPSGISLVLS